MLKTLIDIASEFWDVLTEVSPYLLFGFFVAGLLSVYISTDLVKRHLGRRGILSVFKAAAFGVPLPLCSCGVIPVSASLRRQGASKGATTAFLLSTPQTGADSFLVTLSLLGPIFAVFRPIVALITGVVGGSLVSVGQKEEPSKADEAHCTCDAGLCLVHPKGSKLTRTFRYGFGTLAADVAKPLMWGLLVAAVISALVPENLFAQVLGRGLVPKLAMMALGIPIYVCATASVPIAAALIAKGVSPGAAFVFLMTGPATNAATVATIWKIMGKRTTIIYLLTVAACALLFGTCLDYIFAFSAETARPYMPWMPPKSVATSSAVVVLAVLARAIYKSHPKHFEEMPADKERPMLTLLITGMRCDHCAKTIAEALRRSPGVESADVDFAGGKAFVRGKALDAERLSRVVRDLGYGCASEAQPGESQTETEA